MVQAATPLSSVSFFSTMPTTYMATTGVSSGISTSTVLPVAAVQHGQISSSSVHQGQGLQNSSLLIGRQPTNSESETSGVGLVSPQVRTLITLWIGLKNIVDLTTPEQH